MPHGTPIQCDDEVWVYRRDDPGGGASSGTASLIPGPREFRHALSSVLNGLVEHGFTIHRLADQVSIYPDPNATTGTWDHFVSVAPPWLVVLCCYDG